MWGAQSVVGRRSVRFRLAEDAALHQVDCLVRSRSGILDRPVSQLAETVHAEGKLPGQSGAPDEFGKFPSINTYRLARL